jgi:hypothetical protein
MQGFMSALTRPIGKFVVIFTGVCGPATTCSEQSWWYTKVVLKITCVATGFQAKKRCARNLTFYGFIIATGTW